MAEQCDEPKSRSRRIWQWKINRRDSVIAADYEVLGLGSGVGHFFGIFFLLHDKLSR